MLRDPMVLRGHIGEDRFAGVVAAAEVHAREALGSSGERPLAMVWVPASNRGRATLEEGKAGSR